LEENPVSLEIESPYIWNREQMRAFLKHPSEDVQRWAAEHILLFFPDLLKEVMAFLPQATRPEAPALMDALEEMTLTENAVPALLEVFRNTKHHFDQGQLAVLLARCGYFLPDHELDNLSLPYQFAHTEDGFQYLLRRLFTRRPEHKQNEFCFTLSTGLNGEDIYDFLADKKKPKDKERILDDLGKQYRQPLPKVLMVKDSASTLRLLTSALANYAAFLSSASEGFSALTGQLDRAYERCRLLAEAVQVYLERGGRISPELIPVLLAGALGLTRDLSCRKTLSQDNPSAVDFWSAVIMREWNSPDLDQASMQWLQHQDEKELLAGLDTQLSKGGWIYAASAFTCLASAAIPGRYQFLINAFDQDWPAEIFADVVKALRRSGPEAARFALESLKDNPPFIEDMNWLEVYPTREVVRYLLDNFEHFVQSDGTNIFFDTLGSVGSADFFEPLLKEWRPGEPNIAENILMIAELNRIEDERLKPIASEVKDSRQEASALAASGANLAQIFSNTRVPLRCTACGRTYSYLMKKLYLDDSAPEIIIGDIIQCKGCGSIETYEKTAETYIALTTLLMSEATLHQSKEKKEVESPFQGALKETEVDGKKVKTVSEAYRLFSESLEKEPQNAEYRKRFGNILRNGGRPDLAMMHYIEALKLNSEDIESAYSLAQILIDQNKFREAMPYVEKLGDMLRRVTLEKNRKEEYFGALIMLCNIIYDETGRRVRLRPADRLSQDTGNAGGPRSEVVDFDYTDQDEVEEAIKLFQSGQFTENQFIGKPKMPRRGFTGEMNMKVGRNDPCPCGSGKKYKKCHGING
jgi:tetratricopeptide (TPR) repeat protein